MLTPRASRRPDLEELRLDVTTLLESALLILTAVRSGCETAAVLTRLLSLHHQGQDVFLGGTKKEARFHSHLQGHLTIPQLPFQGFHCSQ